MGVSALAPEKERDQNASGKKHVEAVEVASTISSRPNRVICFSRLQ
jgi:hypothetical protein